MPQTKTKGNAGALISSSHSSNLGSGEFLPERDGVGYTTGREEGPVRNNDKMYNRNWRQPNMVKTFKIRAEATYRSSYNKICLFLKREDVPLVFTVLFRVFTQSRPMYEWES